MEYGPYMFVETTVSFLPSFLYLLFTVAAISNNRCPKIRLRYEGYLNLDTKMILKI